MKKALTITLVCSLIIGTTKLSCGQNISDTQKAKIEKEVDSAFHQMIKIAENVNYDLLNIGVDDSRNAGFIVNGQYFAQYDSLISNLKSRAQNLAKQSINVKKEKITVLADNIALLTAFGDSSVELTTGNAFNVRFYWSFVYVKENGAWKVIQSHQSGAR